jgi:hypothetical protein
MAGVEVGRLEGAGDGTTPGDIRRSPSVPADVSALAAAPAGSPMSPAPGPLASPDRLRTLAPIIVFDVAGPLAVYYGARGAGMSTVLALVVSGVCPPSACSPP